MTRSLIRWQPFNDFVSMRDAMNRAFEESFGFRGGALADESVPSYRLPLDVYETGDELVVKARLPGVDPDDVEITVNNDVLTVKAELHSDVTLDESEKWAWYRHELFCGVIGRSITLPTSVESEKAEATFRNGELTLKLPKAEEVKPRAIKVKAVN